MRRSWPRTPQPSPRTLLARETRADELTQVCTLAAGAVDIVAPKGREWRNHALHALCDRGSLVSPDEVPDALNLLRTVVPTALCPYPALRKRAVGRLSHPRCPGARGGPGGRRHSGRPNR